MNTLDQPGSDVTDPLHVVVMGVSGCGKSTVASAVARQLQLDMTDGDDLHLSESVAKMRSGVALTDADRWPWLDRIGDYLAQATPNLKGRIVACSALKRVYRDRIRARAGKVVFIFLDGDAELIRQRMALRTGHYMPPELLDSQLRTLELPAPDETDILTLHIATSIDALVAQAVTGLRQQALKNPT
ncbi:gluconokinase [Rhodoferax sp.]|uniref:gluconokinase n=1 Tax=Rhodoferax sp. TaxID=50421 RepID=UPI00271A733A|nr:gluconokinase [Rhodoferax sp.]MDO9144748.1 gluconokinase [Rhodoferax sp.]MDP3190812.1 gluconokinase [Rhodoferax sp.]MDP3337958.1 gluconokinase [Rhodoferax sp.]MDP3863266.1 gluconokinase [Rhodoferax sp.]